MRWPALLAVLAALFIVVGAGQVRAQSAPGAPTATVSNPTTNTLTVSWSAPSDGGSAITAYDLHYILTSAPDKAEANWTLEVGVWKAGDGSLQYDLKDLADGTGYDVEVRAVNAIGDGEWSHTATGTTTDYGGTIATATGLSLGSSLPGSLDPASDKDVFRIVLSSDADIWVYTTGDLDTVGELLNSGGAPIAESNNGTLLDSPRGFGIRGEFSAGTYYVRVSSFWGRAAGSYTIHAQTVTDPGDTIATATTVTLDSATPGRIGPTGGDPDDRDDPGDADYFKLVLNATTDVWVVAIGSNEIEGGRLDTVGTLLDADEDQLASNDNGYFLLERLGGFMFRRQLDAGTYYIRVWGFGELEVGPYTLHVRTATEPGSTAASATPLSFGRPGTGRLASASDREHFSLTLAADTYVSIYAVSFGGSVPLTATIRNDQNAVVSMYVIPKTNWAQHGQPGVAFSLWGRLTAGEYHIQIQPSGRRTGSYVLRVLTSLYGPALEECTGLTTPQSDPWYGCQWHLSNTGQFEGGGAMQDINVESVWAGGNMGAGINVVVIDDGLQSNHEDLAANVVTSRNHDYTGRGNVFDPIDTHGTAVAGIIAARDNDVGVRGVAPRASIFGYNILGYGAFTTGRAVGAMYRSEDAQHTAVANNSWGYRPTSLPGGGLGATWESAVERGVTEGYGGKGIFYVWSAGNGHEYYDHANLDEIANFYAVTAACAVGYDDVRSDYSETGANLWVCAPSSSGRVGLPGITTTHQYNRYRDTFGGTSAAAPIVSGVAALVRAADNTLSWRDIKLILAASARQNDSGNSGWEQGAFKYGSTTDRYSFNHEYGFGMVDAAAAVALAGGWTKLPSSIRSVAAESGTLTPPLAIPDAPLLGTPSTLTSSLTLGPHVGFVEFMEIEIELEHAWFRDLQIELVSPSGAISVLSVPSLVVTSSSGGFEGTHRFGSARHLGENADGTWTLRISDRQNLDTGMLKSWKLKAYGHGYTPGYADIDEAVPGPGAFTLTWKPPGDIGGSAVTSYDLRYLLADDPDQSNWTEVTNVGSPSDLQYTLGGLDGETKYFVSVRAVNDAGAGAWSEPYAEETEAVLPGAPRSVSVAARDQALAVSWREPAYLGVGATAYDVHYIRDDAPDKADAFWSTRSSVWTVGGGDLRYVIRGLVNGARYEVQVLARNVRGAGEWSGSAWGTPAAINSPAEFPDSETGQRSVLENTLAGVNIGEPVAARDDEDDTLTYSLSSGGANFELATDCGSSLPPASCGRRPHSTAREPLATRSPSPSTTVRPATEQQATASTTRSASPLPSTTRMSPPPSRARLIPGSGRTTRPSPPTAPATPRARRAPSHGRSPGTMPVPSRSVNAALSPSTPHRTSRPGPTRTATTSTRSRSGPTMAARPGNST